MNWLINRACKICRETIINKEKLSKKTLVKWICLPMKATASSRVLPPEMITTSPHRACRSCFSSPIARQTLPTLSSSTARGKTYQTSLSQWISCSSKTSRRRAESWHNIHAVVPPLQATCEPNYKWIKRLQETSRKLFDWMNEPWARCLHFHTHFCGAAFLNAYLTWSQFPIGIFQEFYRKNLVQS